VEPDRRAEPFKAQALTLASRTGIPFGTLQVSNDGQSFRTIAVFPGLQLWGDLDGISRTQRYFGKGKVIWGLPVSRVLTLAGVTRDVEFSSPLDTKLWWIHRNTGDADIYFVVNGTDSPLNIDLRLRIKGREAEIWDPATGLIEPSSYRFENNKTIVPLQLSERQSLFVVFRNETTIVSKTIPGQSSVILTSLPGPWDISFPPGMGAPEKVQLNKLESLTLSSDEGVKYFSGTANYSKMFDASKKWFQPGSRFILDLGNVGDIAEVTLNGAPLGIVWKPPYQFDISSCMKKGENHLEIKVTNEWTNRLVGDQNAATGKKILNSPLRVFPGQKISDSGLLGPVTILLKKMILLK
jgi:hypothetical protein